MYSPRNRDLSDRDQEKIINLRYFSVALYIVMMLSGLSKIIHRGQLLLVVQVMGG